MTPDAVGKTQSNLSYAGSVGVSPRHFRVGEESLRSPELRPHRPAGLSDFRHAKDETALEFAHHFVSFGQ